jgi:hypothetical protein
MPASSDKPHWFRRLLRLARRCILVLCLIVFIPVIIALGRAGVECRAFSSEPQGQTNEAAPPSVERRRVTAGLSDYARKEDQTYLTLPEWYIVYSADEYAAFIASNPPSRFPYFRAIGQFWQSYYDVCAVTRERYTFNSGYHLSLAVIGTSFTAENIVKGLYENTIGRATEWLSSSELTEEDVYARLVAAEYGTFLHTIPWYEFPFGARLGELWSTTPLRGPNAIRKWERKVALSLEYGSKAIYGWLIRLGTQSVYSAEDLEIQAWAEGISAEMLRQEPRLRIVKSIDDRAAIVAIPRYEAFTQIIPRLAQQGVRFVEIAGNDVILITVLAPRDWEYTLEDGKLLFAMPILTQPERKRVAVQAPVDSLDRVLRALEDSPATLEHIYDY